MIIYKTKELDTYMLGEEVSLFLCWYSLLSLNTYFLFFHIINIILFFLNASFSLKTRQRLVKIQRNSNVQNPSNSLLFLRKRYTLCLSYLGFQRRLWSLSISQSRIERRHSTDSAACLSTKDSFTQRF